MNVEFIWKLFMNDIKSLFVVINKFKYVNRYK